MSLRPTPLRSPIRLEESRGLVRESALANLPRGPAVVTFDPRIISRLKREAAPLLLLPLRLEYRLLKLDARIAKLGAEEIAAERLRSRRARTRDLRQLDKKLAGLRDKAVANFAVEVRSSTQREELWLRWYPDSDFALDGVAAPTESELNALSAFRSAAPQDWWNLSTITAADAWANFARAVGPTRALHLARARGSSTAPTATMPGRIAGLPKRVALYGMSKGAVTQLAVGAPIPVDGSIAYTPDAIEPDQWLASFDQAVNLGMGIRITDPAAIRNAYASEWIIAIGLSDAPMRDEISKLIEDGIANGTFAILPQDSPTNNVPNERTAARNWQDQPSDYLARTTSLERGVHDGRIRRAADLLAEAFNIDPNMVRSAAMSDDTGFEDARAMLRVIAPGILDGSFDGAVWGQEISENDVIDVLATAVSARGALPAAKIGRNAYGILSVSLAGEMNIENDPAFSAQEQAIFGKLAKAAGLMRGAMVNRAQQATARVDPDQPGDIPAAFEAALQNMRTSRRIDLVSDSDGSVKGLGCPYVSGSMPEYQPTHYLHALRSTNPMLLPDPDHENRTWPLLYRLARLTLTRNIVNILGHHLEDLATGTVESFARLPEAERDDRLRKFYQIAGEIGLSFGEGVRRGRGQPAPSRVEPGVVAVGLRLFHSFDQGLAQLQTVAARPNGTAELETLLFEVFDLLQHRADAWLTGVAQARLSRRRAAGGAGLHGGYFGMLSKLRRPSRENVNDGYIQAPSIAQASTAAILRSSYRQHQENGAFNLDLSSRRTRHAMSLISNLSAGAGVSHALGRQAERLLRELPKDASHLIPDLRRLFPIRNANSTGVAPDGTDTGGPSGSSVLDGFALLGATLHGVATDIRNAVKSIQPGLRDDLDAISDLVMAEAVHHRAHGAAQVANAWLKTLSGGGFPGRPTVMKTVRPSVASSHRVHLIMPRPPATINEGMTSPRTIAEPGVAQLAAAAMGSISNLRVTVEARLVADPSASANIEFVLADDLNLSPFDVMIGGVNELKLRARAKFEVAWRDGAAQLAALGAYPSVQAIDEVTAITVTPKTGEGQTAEALITLEHLRKAVAQGRAMEPGDLNAAAPATLGLLSDEAEAQHYVAAAQDLDGRITRLIAAAKAATDSFSVALGQLQAELTALTAELAIDPSSPASALARVAVESSCRRVTNAGERIAVFGAPEVVRTVTQAALFRPGNNILEQLAKARDRLLAQTGNLESIGATPTNLTRDHARAALRLRSQALKDALDGDALPIAPCYALAPTITPATDTGTALPLALQHLAEWQRVRARLGDLAAGLAKTSGYSLFRTSDEATITPADLQADSRPEDSAPKSRHYGVFLSNRAVEGANSKVAGIVIDEWTEQRPGSMQDSAVAVNYNTPGTQAPNVLLLGVPPRSNWRSWSEDSAAQLVAETIDLMRMRALNSDQRLARTSLAPGANSVPHKEVGSTRVKRIPERAIFWGLTHPVGDLSTSGLFVLNAAAPAQAVGISATGINISGGFNKVRE